MEKITILEERGKECKFDYNKNEGKLVISFAGFLATKDASEEFIEQYTIMCAKLNKDNTILILDVRELKPFEQHFLDNLEGLYKDYASFKQVYWVRSKSAVTNSQTQRLLRKIGMEDRFIFVDSISDIK